MKKLLAESKNLVCIAKGKKKQKGIEEGRVFSDVSAN